MTYFNARERLRRALSPHFTPNLDELTRLANKYKSDKGNQHFNRHHYSRIYFEVFHKRRTDPLRILEIGLLHAQDRGWIGGPRNYVGTSTANRAPSLQMWLDFFPNGTIFGFDINDFTGVQLERCSIFRGDMGDRGDLQRLIEQSRGGFDIIIEDASHASQHQQIAFGVLFPSLVPAGIYIIEDLNWQPMEIEAPNAPTTVALLRQLQINHKFDSPFLLDHEKKYIGENVDQIALYDSASPFISPYRNIDAIAVIFKRS